MTGCYLIRDDHTPRRARFPVIDAHNHLWAAWETVDRVVEVMDAIGVACYCDLTANLQLRFADGGYVFQPGDIENFFGNAVAHHPHRFYGFTMAGLARPADQPLFTDATGFVEECTAVLEDHVRRGARGLKVRKELGLHYRDGKGDPKFPRKADLIARRDNLVRHHPGTTFLLPHVANYAEDLVYVGRLLDENPNVHIDFSARCDELGRQPYSAREFIIRYQDRIYFGTDMPASREMYRFHFRFLETFDEYFIPPDYDGTFGRHRWRVHGLGLPDDVLRKIYFENALRLIPGLSKDYAAATGDTP